MVKIVALLSISIILLSACINDDNADNNYSPYLSEEEGRYGLYMVIESEEDEVNFEVLQENDITNVSNFSGTDSLENVELPEIEEAPYYLVFDTEDKVYETNDRSELFEFLREEHD